MSQIGPSVPGLRNLKCVYFTYDGLLDPLGQSQIVPYIQHLVAAGHSFTIISYEKDQRFNTETQKMARRLNELGVQWLRLPFKWGRFEFAKRVLAGIAAVRRVCRSTNPELVHLRGLMPAVIFKLSLARVPFMYDFRGFAVEEWAEIGRTRAGSFAHRMFRLIDRRAVETACGLVVLEKSAESLLRKTYRVPNVPLKVIRTCTDVSLYQPRKDSAASLINFVCLGGARRPYRPDLALNFVSQLSRQDIDCRIEFLNERDHADIASAAQESHFPQDRLAILKVEHKLVPEALQKYDCGLVFLDSSPWRRVCSPTKLAEYLAAGLPVVAMEGIDVLDGFSASTQCVEIVSQGELASGFRLETIDRLVSFIRRPGLGLVCQELAQRECSLDVAGKLYAELYAEIEARL